MVEQSVHPAPAEHCEEAKSLDNRLIIEEEKSQSDAINSAQAASSGQNAANLIKEVNLSPNLAQGGQPRPSSLKNSVIAVMRHGERIDLTFGFERLKTSYRYNDPPLTDTGKKQAFHTGMLIQAYKRHLEVMLNGGAPFDQVILEASPFLRTMQTCAMVCKAIKVDQFRLNYQFCEHLEPKMQVGENPIPMLTVKQAQTEADKEAFSAEHLAGVNFIDDDQHLDYVQSRYPESDAQVRERASDALKGLIRQYAESTHSTLHLIVTHGTLVKQFSQVAGMRKKKVKFCGLSAIGVKPKGVNDKLEVTQIANCRNNHQKQFDRCLLQ